MDGLQTYAHGVHILRVFHQQGRYWYCADDLIRMLKTTSSNFWRNVEEDHRSQLERGLELVSVERGTKLAFTMRTEKAREIAKWLLVEVVPQIYTENREEHTHHSRIACRVVRK